MRVACYFLIALSCSPAVAQGCFRSLAEAARQGGVEAAQGFRLVDMHVDRIGGTRWARVASCSHPEQPATLVGMPFAGGAGDPGAAPRKQSLVRANPIVRAGQTVQVLRLEADAHLETTGVAEGDGALGDQVSVRFGMAGAERSALATVRSSGLVELEAAR